MGRDEPDQCETMKALEGAWDIWTPKGAGD